MIDSKPFSGAAEARHDFIGDHQDAVFVAEFADPLEIAVGWNKNSVCSGDWFQNEGGDCVRAFELNGLLDHGQRGFGGLPSAFDAMVGIENVDDARDAGFGGPA